MKNLKKEDIKSLLEGKKGTAGSGSWRSAETAAFARKMQPVWKWMNRLSLLFHALLACVINFAIEAISRHSVFEAWDYMTETPVVFLVQCLYDLCALSQWSICSAGECLPGSSVSVLWLILGVAQRLYAAEAGDAVQRSGSEGGYGRA